MHAKECLERIIDHAEFQTKLERYVSPEDIRHVSDAIRKSSAGRRHNSWPSPLFMNLYLYLLPHERVQLLPENVNSKK